MNCLDHVGSHSEMVLLGRVLTQQSDDLELEGAPEDEETDSVSQLKSIGRATVTTEDTWHKSTAEQKGTSTWTSAFLRA